MPVPTKEQELRSYLFSVKEIVNYPKYATNNLIKPIRDHLNKFDLNDPRISAGQLFDLQISVRKLSDANLRNNRGKQSDAVILLEKINTGDTPGIQNLVSNINTQAHSTTFKIAIDQSFGKLKSAKKSLQPPSSIAQELREVNQAMKAMKEAMSEYRLLKDKVETAYNAGHINKASVGNLMNTIDKADECKVFIDSQYKKVKDNYEAILSDLPLPSTSSPKKRATGLINFVGKEKSNEKKAPTAFRRELQDFANQTFNGQPPATYINQIDGILKIVKELDVYKEAQANNKKQSSSVSDTPPSTPPKPKR